MKTNQTIIEYDSFHCIPKSLKRVRLVKDAADAHAFKMIIARSCLALGFTLFGFGFLNTHIHYAVGLKRYTETKPDPAWLREKIKSFVWNVNRAYGKYFRSKYKYRGNIFTKNSDTFSQINHSDAFANTLTYIHNNATFVNKYPIFEDDPCNSYNFYLATFVQNPEFQSLPEFRKICASPDDLTVFNAMDLEYAIRQYGTSRFLRNCISAFISAHRKALLLRDAKHNNSVSTQRYAKLGILPLLEDPSLLQLAPTKGHKVKRFVDELAGAEITREIVADYFHSFSALFPWHAELVAGGGAGAGGAGAGAAAGLKASYSRIRDEFPTDFDNFIREMAKKTSILSISNYTGTSRHYIRKVRRE